MPSDLQALLAAIVADPSDDVARLVYADCLEENGNSARAVFIRLQIEAQRLHPASRDRANLERQVDEILQANWSEWWGEVCTAIGFPAPVPKPATLLGRFARRFSSLVTGAPYTRSGCWLNRAPVVPDPKVFGGFSGVWFRRGFLEDVTVAGPGDFLRGWVKASPLHSLTFHTAYHGWWLDGPHLAGVRAVALLRGGDNALPRVLESPHLGNLEDLALPLPGDQGPTASANDLTLVVNSPRARQLKRLAVSVWDDRAAELLASTASFAGLESLGVFLEREVGRDPVGASRRLATLARSPHLAGLKELDIQGSLDPDGIAAAGRQPTWTGLRKLSLGLSFGYNRLDPLAEPDGVPQLDDLRLNDVWINAAEVDVLVRSPLLKRLRHFALAGAANYRPVLALLTSALDITRIETFSLALPRVELPGSDGTDALRQHFGDKLQLL